MSGVEERLRALLEESGIPQAGSEELAALLASLEERYVDDATPEPGPELAALLGEGGRPASTRTPPLRRRHRAALTGLAALGVALGTGWAAAANELPAPAQHWVAEFSQRFLPFDLPFPESAAPGRTPEPAKSDRSARWLDEHDAHPTPAEGADEKGLPTRRQAPQEASWEVVDGDSGVDDGDEGGQTSVEEAPEEAGPERPGDAGETSDAEATPDRTRESAETQQTDAQESEPRESEPQQTESSESADSEAEPAGSTSGDVPEESSGD